MGAIPVGAHDSLFIPLAKHLATFARCSFSAHVRRVGCPFVAAIHPSASIDASFRRASAGVRCVVFGLVGADDLQKSLVHSRGCQRASLILFASLTHPWCSWMVGQRRLASKCHGGCVWCVRQRSRRKREKRRILAPLRDRLRASRLPTILREPGLVTVLDQFVEGAAAVDALLSDG